MTDAPLDLEPIRARLSGLWAGGYPVAPGWPAQGAQDVKALIAEVERLRKLVPPLLLCQGGEMVQVTDMGAWLRGGGFGGSRGPFRLGGVIAESGGLRTEPDPEETVIPYERAAVDLDTEEHRG